MLEEELQIKEHQSLLVIMYELCGKMPDVIIFNYFDNNRYLYSLFFEAFNSIKGVCLLLGQGCLISQASTVLRMALERVVTIRVLIMNKNIMNEYIEHQKFRYDIRDEENKKLLKEQERLAKQKSKEVSFNERLARKATNKLQTEIVNALAKTAKKALKNSFKNFLK